MIWKFRATGIRTLYWRGPILSYRIRKSNTRPFQDTFQGGK